MLEHNLPAPLTMFVGRETELADCISLLKQHACKLLTLTGPGGVGKTRLALEIARPLVDVFADGVYFVPLQSLQSADNVISAIVVALPMQQRDESDLKQQLLDYLRHRQILLILDNMEHLLASTPIIEAMLTLAPQLKLLVTSRVPMKLREEWVWQVAGLAYPADNDIVENDDAAYSAIQLFTERARRLKHTFDLQEEYPQVVRVCQLVDGLPLALELAASWINVMSGAAIVDEIEHGIHTLSTLLHNVEERHRSMRTVFDHSWQLLSDEEQRVLQRLSIFRGGFTRDAAEVIAGASLPILATCVDRSMIKTDSGERYDLHELLRQYIEEKLIASGESAAVHDAHESYYAAFLQQRETDLKGPKQIATLAEIEADFENVRAAWNRAAISRHDGAITQMIGGLWVFCEIWSREQEAYRLFRYAERQFAPERDDQTNSLWQRLLARAASGDTLLAELETALRLAQQLNDPVESAFCLARLGKAAHRKGENSLAEQWLLQSLSISRQLDDHFAASGVLFWLLTTWDGERWEEFRQYGEEALRRSSAIGDSFGYVRSLSVAAVDASRSGRFEEAESLWLKRIALGKAINNLEMIGSSYVILSYQVYFYQGKFEQARAAAEETIRIGNIVGLPPANPLVVLGIIASASEDYEAGIRLCKQGASLGWDPFTSQLAAWGMAIASCGLGDYVTARESLLIAYTHLAPILGQVGLVAILPIMAAISAHQGNPMRVVELLALAFTHPIRAFGWMEKWALLDRLRTELEDKLGSEVYAAAWERGSLLKLEETADLLIRQLRSEVDGAAVQANLALSEPLTERELEVLALMAEGLSNPQIAERLVITKGTTRGHINKIYQKLGTSNRVEAVLHAQALHLV